MLQKIYRMKLLGVLKMYGSYMWRLSNKLGYHTPVVLFQIIHFGNVLQTSQSVFGAGMQTDHFSDPYVLHVPLRHASSIH